MNIYSLLNAKATTVFAVVLSVLVALVFVVAVILLWWTEIKQRSLRDFWRAICRFFRAIGEKLAPNRPVKTIYSDRARNYSGTEFLPVPAKAPTKEYTYEFVGWDKNYTDANGNTVAKPIYIQKVNTCRVNVFDDDGETLIKSFVIEYGSGVDLSDIHLKKQESKEFTYEFIGWDKDTTSFYKNENIYAVYKARPKMFTYTFYDEDGKTIISQTTAIYGTPVLAPEAPKKEGLNTEFAYYSGFEEGMILDRNLNFTAVYKHPDNEMAQQKTEPNETMIKQSLASFESDRVEVFGAGEKSLLKQKKQEPQKVQAQPAPDEVRVFNLAGTRNVPTSTDKPEIHINEEYQPSEEAPKKRKIQKLEAKTEIADPDAISSSIKILGVKQPK